MRPTRIPAQTIISTLFSDDLVGSRKVLRAVRPALTRRGLAAKDFYENIGIINGSPVRKNISHLRSMEHRDNRQNPGWI